MATDDKCQQEINELKKEIKLLKQSKKQQYDPKTEMYRNTINSESKNGNTPSVSHGDQQKDVELITIINFIEETMKTLSNYRKQLKTQLEIFRKDVTYDNAKSHQKPGLHAFSEKQIFGKTTGGVKLTPPASLGLIYLRFIDDIFLIWAGNKKDLMKFLIELNRKHESIKLKYT